MSVSNASATGSTPDTTSVDQQTAASSTNGQSNANALNNDTATGTATPAGIARPIPSPGPGSPKTALPSPPSPPPNAAKDAPPSPLPSSASQNLRPNTPPTSLSLAGEPSDPTDAAVLAYLRKRGLGHAILELSKKLKEEEELSSAKDSKSSSNSKDSSKNPSKNSVDKEKASILNISVDSIEDETIEEQELRERDTRSHLTLSSGGGFGYDLESSPGLVQWGTGTCVKKQNFPNGKESTLTKLSEKKGGIESKRYIESYTALQTWLLCLPDDPDYAASTDPFPPPPTSNALGTTVHNLLSHKIHMIPPLNSQHGDLSPSSPGCIKSEATTVAFPLFVHTYCELLECGLEHDAVSFFCAFKHVHEMSHYTQELVDLERCVSTELLAELNCAIYHSSEAHNEIRKLHSKITSLKILTGRMDKTAPDANNATAPVVEDASKKNQKNIEAEIDYLESEENAIKVKSSQYYGPILKKFPFLARARSLRWQIHLSEPTFAVLSDFLSRQIMTPMSALLHSRCHVIVEGRDPIGGYIPPCLFEEDADNSETNEKQSDDDGTQWAAPLHPSSRAAIAGQSLSVDNLEQRPFPSFENAFNKSLLLHGFRRLEALEVKREYDSGMRTSNTDNNKRTKTNHQRRNSNQQTKLFANPHTPTILQATLTSSKAITSHNHPSTNLSQPGIHVTCAKFSPGDGRRVAVGCDDAAIRIHSLDTVTAHSDTHHRQPHEPTTVLYGHKHGAPIYSVSWCRDGRSLLSAGGDGGLRLWDTAAVGPYGTSVAKIKPRVASATVTNKESTLIPPPQEDTRKARVPGYKSTDDASFCNVRGAALCVYRGHAANMPVWDVSFAPCGYYFLSTGADGTGRIWTTDCPNKPARILVGHKSGVSSSSSSFMGGVTCGEWHPNCNYVLTGGDDGIVRMWDVQSGRCVRVLTGMRGSISIVRVCPSGRFAVGAQENGIIGMWDLGSGRMVNRFVHNHAGINETEKNTCRNIHAMSYSACGTALAAGGDDCAVKIWDVRGAAFNWTVPEYAKANDWSGRYQYGGRRRESENVDRGGGTTNAGGNAWNKEPIKVYNTRRTVVLDLMYTKRNLLMSAGTFVGSRG